MSLDINTFDIKKFDKILARGLCFGLGKQGQQVCIEAAICEALGLEHGDDPECVASSVRIFKVSLNDSGWSSPQTRAAGLRDLGLAQLGSLGVIDDTEFVSKLTTKTISVLIPKLFREIFPNNAKCLSAALKCEKEGNAAAANAAAAAAVDAAVDAACSNARYTATYAATAARYAAAADAAAAVGAATARYAVAASDAYAATAARYAAAAAGAAAAAAAAAAARNASYAISNVYLFLIANLALEILKALKSPGVKLLES